MRIDAKGHLKDWTDFPPTSGRPVGATSGESKKHRVFTTEQENNLLEWCAAAELQGVEGSRIFEQLEGIVSPTRPRRVTRCDADTDSCPSRSLCTPP